MNNNILQVVSVRLFVNLRSPYMEDVILTDEDALELVQKYFKLHDMDSINGISFDFELDRVESCNP